MLDPDYIDKAGDMVAAAYTQIEAEMLDYLVAQMLLDEKLTSRGYTSLAMLAQTHDGALREILRRNSGGIAAAVMASVEDALKRSDEDDVRRLGGGRTAYHRQVAATVDGIARILERDNLDMIDGAKRAFLEASTRAITSVNISATTPDKAIHEAVRQLEREGISIISYRNAATGRQTVKNKVDVAVRRHVRTQIAQDGARMTLERMNELDVALVEVSSHPGARPEHAEWQGRCYSLKGDVTIGGVRYRDFYSATGYGTVEGLLGANCRHSFAPYIHGTRHAYAHDPKHASGVRGDEVYRLTQKQRYIERRIREAKRELRGAQAEYDADRSAEKLAEVMKAKQAIKSRQEAMRKLLEEANAKAKPGTSVLHRNQHREWAGDMPKTTGPARTKHGTERMRERGITERAAASAITSPLKRLEAVADDNGRRAQKLVGKDATVIINPDTGEIITAYKTKARIARKYEREAKEAGNAG